MSTLSSREESFHDTGMSPFVPVQGQKRGGGEKSRKSKKPEQGGQQTAKDKNNCKQQ